MCGLILYFFLCRQAITRVSTVCLSVDTIETYTDVIGIEMQYVCSRNNACLYWPLKQPFLVKVYERNLYVWSKEATLMALPVYKFNKDEADMLL